MTKRSRDKASFPLDDTPFAIKQRKPVPHEFVLDAMVPLSPGCECNGDVTPTILLGYGQLYRE